MKSYLKKYLNASELKTCLNSNFKRLSLNTNMIRPGTGSHSHRRSLVLGRAGPGARLALRPGLADPVVLVHPRPREGESGPVRIEALRVQERRVGPSGDGSVGRERVSGEGLPLLPQPGLRGAGRKLAEL